MKQIKISPSRTPWSKRYCLKCKGMTTWRFDKKIQHSRCQTCGADSKYSRLKKVKVKGLNKLFQKKTVSYTNIATKEL